MKTILLAQYLSIILRHKNNVVGCNLNEECNSIKKSNKNGRINHWISGCKSIIAGLTNVSDSNWDKVLTISKEYSWIKCWLVWNSNDSSIGWYGRRLIWCGGPYLTLCCCKDVMIRFRIYV